MSDEINQLIEDVEEIQTALEDLNLPNYPKSKETPLKPPEEISSPFAAQGRYQS